MSPKWRKRAAWVLLCSCLIMWPVSSLTFAKDEPQAVLGLSWFALILTSLDITQTTDVRDQQKEGD